MAGQNRTNNSDELVAMVVEDNDHMRTLLRTLLKELGIRKVFEFSDGAAALAQLGFAKPDFILADLSMAGMDGLTFTRALRHMPDDAQCVVPIIMVTGHTERRRVEAARDAGVNELLAKPITPASLFNRIDRIVNHPRLFVRSEDYTGPCRRRKNDPYHQGPWRRAGDKVAQGTVSID